MIVVTGANGLLGSEVVKQLTDSGESVIALKRKTSIVQNALVPSILWKEADLMDTLSLEEAFKGSSTVIHTAALVSFNPKLKDELFKVNVEGTKNVVNACLSTGVKKLIYVSSVAAIGRQKDTEVLAENNKWSESPLNSTYAKSKHLAELEVYRGQEEGLAISIINPSLILACSNWQRSSSQIFKYVWNESPFYSEGLINYVDVQDVAAMIIELKKSTYDGQRYIASSGAVSYNELFKQIASRFNKKEPRIKVNRKLVTAFALVEEMRCMLLGTNPLITRESVKATLENHTFSNSKSIRELNQQYQKLSITLDRCCQYYISMYSTNK